MKFQTDSLLNLPATLRDWPAITSWCRTEGMHSHENDALVQMRRLAIDHTRHCSFEITTTHNQRRCHV